MTTTTASAKQHVAPALIKAARIRNETSAGVAGAAVKCIWEQSGFWLSHVTLVRWPSTWPPLSRSFIPSKYFSFFMASQPTSQVWGRLEFELELVIFGPRAVEVMKLTNCRNGRLAFKCSKLTPYNACPTTETNTCGVVRPSGCVGVSVGVAAADNELSYCCADENCFPVAYWTCCRVKWLLLMLLPRCHHSQSPKCANAT